MISLTTTTTHHHALWHDLLWPKAEGEKKDRQTDNGPKGQGKLPYAAGQSAMPSPLRKVHSHTERFDLLRMLAPLGFGLLQEPRAYCPPSGVHLQSLSSTERPEQYSQILLTMAHPHAFIQKSPSNESQIT